MSLEYYHYDHQGSLLEVYDGTTNKRLLSQAWSPWGERKVLHTNTGNNNAAALLAKGLPAHIGYTGHKELLATGLIFAGDTRLYDPRLKRFLNSDDRTTGGVRGQNRYSYAYNNPMAYTDPDGRAPRSSISRRRRQQSTWQNFIDIQELIRTGANIASHRHPHRGSTLRAETLLIMQQGLENFLAAKITAHMRGFVTRKRRQKVLHLNTIANIHYREMQQFLGVSMIDPDGNCLRAEVNNVICQFLTGDKLSSITYRILDDRAKLALSSNEARYHRIRYALPNINDTDDVDDSVMVQHLGLNKLYYNPSRDPSIMHFYVLEHEWADAKNQFAAKEGLLKGVMALSPESRHAIMLIGHLPYYQQLINTQPYVDNSLPYYLAYRSIL